MVAAKKQNKHSGVYLAKNIARDINAASREDKLTNGKLELTADPINDLIARALAEGRLTARNAAGRPMAAPAAPGDFLNLYVATDEVNQILAEGKYLEKWEPKPVQPRRPKQETPAQRATNYGWEVVVREEATRHFTEVKKQTGQELTQSALARHLRQWVVKHGINSQWGRPPEEGTIRNQLQPRYWKRLQ